MNEQLNNLNIQMIPDHKICRIWKYKNVHLIYHFLTYFYNKLVQLWLTNESIDNIFGEKTAIS